MIFQVPASLVAGMAQCPAEAALAVCFPIWQVLLVKSASGCCLKEQKFHHLTADHQHSFLRMEMIGMEPLEFILTPTLDLSCPDSAY